VQIGQLFVRRSVFINALPDRIWQEFGDLARVRSWLGIGQTLHAYSPEVGVEISLSVEMDSGPKFFGGKVVLVDQEKELTFENQWQAPSNWVVPTFWTFRLTQIYAGTQVEFFHHGFERLGEAAADNLQGYEQGWTTNHLDALRSIIEAN